MATLGLDGQLIGSEVTWGGGVVLRDSWGQVIPVADPPVALSDVGIPLADQPLRVWRSQPSVRKVVDFAARNVAMVPLHVYARASDTDRVRDTDSTAARLLANPGLFVTGSRLVHDLVVDLMLYDRWLVIHLDGQLRRVPAGLIDVKSDFLGGVTALRVRTPDGLVPVTDAVVAYDAGWSADGEGGESPMRTLGELLEEQRRAVRWRRDMWQNGARVSGVMTSDEMLSTQLRDRLANTWTAYRDAKAGGVPLLEKVAFTPMKPPKPVDTQDLEGRKLTDAEVASAYHIPPELVGARPGTFANVKAFREMLYGPVLGPILTRIEDALNYRIIPALGPVAGYAEFNREAALAGSFAEQAAWLQKAVGGPYMTRAEARARQNLPYLEGTDELITPKNVSEGGLADPSDTAPNHVGDDAEKPEEGVA